MSFNWEEKSLLWGNLHGDHSPAPSALPLQPSQRVRLSVPAASPLLRAELGFLIRSGQNTAVVSLDCEPLKWGAPRLWVSGGLFRQGELEDDGKQLGNEGLAADPKSWDCWGSWLFSSCLGLLQVCVLGSCRMGVGGLVCGSCHKAERFLKLLVYLCCIPFVLGVLSCSLAAHQRGFLAQLLLKEISSSLP